jgi:hypothetical protein
MHLNRMKIKGMRKRLAKHLALFAKLWAAFVIVAEDCIAHGGYIAIEWPRACEYWRNAAVLEFVQKHQLTFADFDGCMYELKDGAGVPIRKPWRLATNSPSLVNHFSLCCDETHEHTPCAGSQTERTGNYTPCVAACVHRALLEQIRADGRASFLVDSSKKRRKPPVVAACARLSIAALSTLQRHGWALSQATDVETGNLSVGDGALTGRLITRA